ncbi:hypothetical protein TSUD_322160 [Trifolium subterraneum]|uniref:Uncharacterized protein n=1 Tax=Trifolium subterraneum TaxID=3900 RepID=A0A2Z6NHA4_TRISU|nr:hypothetical protein TSUD_322160 [Trifolium subterraneum]
MFDHVQSKLPGHASIPNVSKAPTLILDTDVSYRSPGQTEIPSIVAGMRPNSGCEGGNDKQFVHASA